MMEFTCLKWISWPSSSPSWLSCLSLIISSSIHLLPFLLHISLLLFSFVPIFLFARYLFDDMPVQRQPTRGELLAGGLPVAICVVWSAIGRRCVPMASCASHVGERGTGLIGAHVGRVVKVRVFPRGIRWVQRVLRGRSRWSSTAIRRRCWCGLASPRMCSQVCSPASGLCYVCNLEGRQRRKEDTTTGGPSLKRLGEGLFSLRSSLDDQWESETMVLLISRCLGLKGIFIVSCL